MRNGGIIGKAVAGYGRFDLHDQQIRQVAEAWPPDPHWDKVLYLNHCDGSNGSAYIRASDGLSPVASGNAGLSTTFKKFGTASVAFDGSADNIRLLSQDFAWGTEDFTIEFWINPTTGGHGGTWSRVCQFGNNSTNGGLWIVCINNENPTRILCQTYNGGYVDVAQSTNTLTNDAWTHLAFVRQGTTYYLFFNGALEQSTTNSSGANITANEVWMGTNQAAGESFKGYLDDIRITRGVARYTSAFTPPAYPFPNG